jgi:hypothetical protein
MIDDSRYFPCPFCKGQFSASAEPPSVLHSIPVCVKFTELDPDKFLVAAREAREAKPS